MTDTKKQKKRAKLQELFEKKIFSSWLTFFQIYKVWLTIDVSVILLALIEGEGGCCLFDCCKSEKIYSLQFFEIDLFVLRDSKLWWFMKKILKE